MVGREPLAGPRIREARGVRQGLPGNPGVGRPRPRGLSVYGRKWPLGADVGCSEHFLGRQESGPAGELLVGRGSKSIVNLRNEPWLAERGCRRQGLSPSAGAGHPGREAARGFPKEEA